MAFSVMTLKQTGGRSHLSIESDSRGSKRRENTPPIRLPIPIVGCSLFANTNV